jgi:hypothetical protein
LPIVDCGLDWRLWIVDWIADWIVDWIADRGLDC